MGARRLGKPKNLETFSDRTIGSDKTIVEINLEKVVSFKAAIIL